MATLRAPLFALGIACLLRGVLLFDDPWPPGWDGWYYVLQADSWAAGQPLFTDRSLVYPLLALARLVHGDAILGNKLVAIGLAGLTAAGGAVAMRRWNGSEASAWVTGVWWATSPLHLALTADFLKNQAGLAAFAWLLAELAGPTRRGRLALGLLLVLGTHKLMGVLAVLLLLGWALWRGLARTLPPGQIARFAGLALVATAALGVLRPVDWQRLGTLEGASRWALWQVSPLLAAEVALLHLAPLGLLLARRRRDVALGVFLVALACTAPGLPFSFEGLGWRLLLVGFVPLGLVAGLAVAGRPALAVPVLLALGAQSVVAARDQATREPDYARLATALPVLAEAVPPDGLVVARRGVCGMIWAEGGRRCENFAPEHVDGVWRVVYGVSARRLAPFGAVTPLVGPDVLVQEQTWRAYAAAHPDEALVNHDFNPHKPRPDYVFRPGGQR